MAKRLLTFRADGVTVQEIEDLKRWDNTTQTGIIARATHEMWEKRRRKMMQERAEKIYSYYFGHLDDRAFRAEKIQEIAEWLEAGDAGTMSDAELLAEWGEIDDADIWAQSIKTKHTISIDNGNDIYTPEQAVAMKPWEVIVNLMDDDEVQRLTGELAPCSEVEFLRAYLAFGPIVVG